MSVKIRLFSAGFCYQIEKIVLNNGKWKSIRFPATFALIEHFTEGYILFDTGYSSYLFDGTKSFPMSLYPKITPITFQEKDSAVNQLIACGIAPELIRSIVLSHFHIDHMGGLRDFPKAKFFCTRSATDSIRNLKGIKALIRAFMPELLPNNFWERTNIIDDRKPPIYRLDYPEFEHGYDLFGDGSLVAVPLPGHAIGQIGLFISTEKKTILLAADACWSSKAYRQLIYPHPLARIVIADNKAFNITLQKLHRLHQLRPDIAIIPTHCEEVRCSQY